MGVARRIREADRRADEPYVAKRHRRVQRIFMRMIGVKNWQIFFDFMSHLNKKSAILEIVCLILG